MHIQIFDCFVFLIILLFNYYKMSMFIFGIQFALKFTLSVINIIFLVFLYLLFVLYIFLSIYFQFMCILIFEACLLQTGYCRILHFKNQFLSFLHFIGLFSPLL